jgi:hypothetical protein
VSSIEAEERSFEADEEALYAALRDGGRDVLKAGAATLAVTWRRLADGPSWPTFELRPRNPDALPIGVSLGGDWIETSLYVDGTELTFELWAETAEERLREIQQRIEAVVAGRVEVELRQSGGRLLRTWALRARFYLSNEPDETSRAPAGLRDYRHLFPPQPGDEASGLLGPRRFSPYIP